MKMIATFAAAAAALAVAATPAAAQEWVLLANPEIGSGRDRQVVAVAGAGRFSQLRLCVMRQAVHLYDVTVRFRSGGDRSVLIGLTLPNFRCTSNISLGGADREISEVAFTYRGSGIRRRGARVRVDAQ